MVCQGCHRLSPEILCRTCRSALRPAPDRLIADGIRAIAAFQHTGVAARLVHDFKYRGSGALVGLTVAVLAGRLAPGTVFVPIPRAWSRYLRYGIDPGTMLARALARATGGSVCPVLARPWHYPRRAHRGDRGTPPRQKPRSGLQEPFVLVDDVLTTGATVIEAMRALRPARPMLVVTATSARGVSSLFAQRPGSPEMGSQPISGDPE